MFEYVLGHWKFSIRSEGGRHMQGREHAARLDAHAFQFVLRALRAFDAGNE